jgi:hypothetical protein
VACGSVLIREAMHARSPLPEHELATN